MDFVFKLIVFSNTFWFESIVGNIVTVGNYSQLNHKTCGFSRHSIGVDTTCMKWHKNILSPLRRAKNVTFGDAPWVALLNLVSNEVPGGWTCSGSVIADQWILTAAHCFEKNPILPIEIYLGYNFTLQNRSRHQYYEGVNITLHPKYNDTFYIYDLALLRMNKPINTGPINNGMLENSICLPQRWSGGDCRTDKTPCKVYAMISGWGPGDHIEEQHLQMAYLLVYNERWSLDPDPLNHSMSPVVELKRLGKQTICLGDSGAPIWQYYMGRAVILGIFTDLYTRDEDNMGCNSLGEGRAAGMWVDQEIDWIMNVTKLN